MSLTAYYILNQSNQTKAAKQLYCFINFFYIYTDSNKMEANQRTVIHF